VLEDNPDRLARFREMFPNATLVTTADKCIEAIQTRQFTICFLDHDLGGEVYVDTQREDCGMEVVRFLEKLEVRGNFASTLMVHVHSHNTPAAEAMVRGLERAGYKAFRTPFGRAELFK
jgi:hypothetical protein